MRLAWRMLFFFISTSNCLKSRNFLQRTLSSSSSKFVSLKSSFNGITISVPSGLVAVFKPKDWTSSDVVSKIKGILSKGMQERCGNKRFKIKVGHGGTLDPLAEGVLVLGVGQGTKLMGEYLSGSKGYQAVAILGSETDTLDNTGTVTATVDSSSITEDQLRSALDSFRGDIMQMPPMYSALKRDGKKLYELAREGITVERDARPVTVYSLDLTKKFQEDPSGVRIRSISLPSFGLDISSSGGFYVRSLISDLAKSCGGRAHMTDLLRVRQGPFVIADCIVQENWDFDSICQGLLDTNSKVGLIQKDLAAAAEGEASSIDIKL
jgi:tRNA pseudouridine55 synthase